ncbi:MAG: L-aspartate oxidase [Actinobacteria bacterium]|uniref:L-aspartate oxidase n=1 Tax=freshwater metagenome TaxID=449393 RepID=A0A6J7N2Y1_9ZZZZ|nr:L-aspartate oxidase [Actinomycetota bacterium]MSW04790.1 L-aspartate oxidase [Actinomycetota bacterium]MSX32606.1 L-aspartate oxidase [Actinomycetota bacterium]MSX82196.1 L-aspartate oxidase [Actinomycetota bacterium]MSY06257.1 L-aspartate oxidase [Actinomycetota bacterium]
MLDLLVLGSGIAGLSAAIRAADAGLKVTVLTKGAISNTATNYAQGGVAAALSEPDSPALHRADTLEAGGGLCDIEAVDVLVREGPRRVRDLMALGAEFDRAAIDGELELAREGGHSLARVVHAGGDATGAEIERALVAALDDHPGIEARERWFTVDLILEGGAVVGVTAIAPDGTLQEVRARNVLLATGGAGQLFAVTTNPPVSTGDGIAMAYRAGAAIADTEFMQFHPTALDVALMPRPLLSEALRGEGAVLRDENGEAFMKAEHPLGDLAPRDVVARAITRRLVARNLAHLFLDATAITDFAQRFPTVARAAQAAGLDPEHDLLPVAPAAHYLSGGICTDLDGATTLPGLWACGEVACSGVHGANRLASNSLLDGLVFAPRAVEAILDGRQEPLATGVLRSVLSVVSKQHAVTTRVSEVSAAGGSITLEALQRAMTFGAGVLRDAGSLTGVLDVLPLSLPAETPAQYEINNLVTVARTLVTAALRREESRGTHTRLDFTEQSPQLLGRFIHLFGSEASFVPLVTHVQPAEDVLLTDSARFSTEVV